MICAVANQARADIDQWVQQAKVNLNQSVDSLARELQLQRAEDAYTEKDLERWRHAFSQRSVSFFLWRYQRAKQFMFARLFSMRKRIILSN